MELNGIEFGSVTGASGVQGFFGEGYRFHRFAKPFGLDFAGMTFVAKTTTLHQRDGNMPLRNDYSPRELRPRCVYVNARSFRKGAVLNAVGLSGPGAIALFERREWQYIQKPFFLSFMSVEATAEKRLQELEGFLYILAEYLPDFRAKFGLQLNFSCPNVGGHAYKDLVAEVSAALSMCDMGFPVVPKFSVTMPPETAKVISDHPNCAAICVSNTIPWNALPERERRDLFGTTVSPLAHLGGGGVSGAPLLPRLIRWIVDYRACGGKKPLNAGGGILAPFEAVMVLGTAPPNSSVFIGSCAILRPWRVQPIIRRVSWAKERMDKYRVPAHVG